MPPPCLSILNLFPHLPNPTLYPDPHSLPHPSQSLPPPPFPIPPRNSHLVGSKSILDDKSVDGDISL